MLEPAPRSTYLAHPADWSWCGVRLLNSEEVCGLDTETVGCNPDSDTAVGTARVVVFSVAIPEGELHPRGYRLADGFVLPPQALEDKHIREWLESPKKKVAHNGRYDRHALKNEDINVQGLVDTLDIYRTIAPGRERYGVKALVPDFLGCETYGDFRVIFSDEIRRRSEKTIKYKVCVVHGRFDKIGTRKYCEVCDDPLVPMSEVVVTETVLKQRRMISMAEVCDVQVRSNVACGSRLVIEPGSHRLWSLLVDYAGFDAIAAAWLYQVRRDRLDGHRPAKVPVL